ncbi:MAG: hypothetical protein IPK67_00600 [Planctomycetes bacterium]|nr:hypothetical protein [Planctomycetota bacterium]
MIPLEAQAFEAPPEQIESDSVRVSIDPAALGSAIETSLRDASFVRVSTLRGPGEQPRSRTDGAADQEMEPRDDRAHRDWWVDRAIAENVDLLALGTITFSPAASGAINDRFWLNLPLFLLGGPMCWFVGDRSYTMQARLDLRLYDVRLIEQKRAELGDRAAEISSYQVEYSGAALSFVERSGRNVGSYALSILIPSGLLSRSNDRIGQELQEDAVDSLVALLREGIDGDRERLLLPSGVNFSVRPEEVAARRTSDGFVSVEGRIHFVPDSRVESLRGFSCPPAARRQLSRSAPLWQTRVRRSPNRRPTQSRVGWRAPRTPTASV